MNEFLSSLGIALIVLVLLPVLTFAIVVLVIYDIIMAILMITGITVAYCVDSICKCFRKPS